MFYSLKINLRKNYKGKNSGLLKVFNDRIQGLWIFSFRVVKFNFSN